MPLFETLETVNSVTDFVFGDGLETAIGTFTGDTHMKAAGLALKAAKRSPNKRDRINVVIAHLEDAHFAYLAVWEQEGVSGFIKGGTSFGESFIACQKDMFACSVMALCYASIYEKQNALESLKIAEVAYEAVSTVFGRTKISNAPRSIVQSYIRDLSYLNLKRLFGAGKIFFKLLFLKNPLPPERFIEFRDRLRNIISEMPDILDTGS